MHLCDYHYADVVLTLAYASVYFRSAFTAIGQKMSDYEAAHVCVLLIYLAHSFLLDETCPLRRGFWGPLFHSLGKGVPFNPNHPTRWPMSIDTGLPSKWCPKKWRTPVGRDLRAAGFFWDYVWRDSNAPVQYAS
ncbi:unnamed protein product [Effrenium voratum]|nr:unnamed protein product [Effrenium voratum]